MCESAWVVCRPHSISQGSVGRRIAWNRIASQRIASHRSASQRIASQRIASQRIAAQRSAAYRGAAQRIAAHGIARCRYPAFRQELKYIALAKLQANNKSDPQVLQQLLRRHSIANQPKHTLVRCA